MRPGPRAALLVTTLAILGARAPGIRAQPADTDQARQEYEDGYRALQHGDYEAALAHYQRSYQLAPRPRTLFNLAVSEEKLGRLEDAIHHYARFLEVAEARDEAFVKQAKQKIDALSKQLPAPVPVDTGPPPPPVAVTPPPPVATPADHPDGCRVHPGGTLHVRSNLAGATVSVDGLVVGTTADRGGAGAALRYPLTPGDHDVVVERPGAAPWRERVHAAPDETIGVDVAFRPARSGGRRALTWGLAGLGVVSGAAGGTLGVLALRDVTSPDPGRHGRGKTRALVTDGLLVVGVAALYGAWRLHHHAHATTATVHTAYGAEAGR
jgi:PEGA domain